jgi:colicin import membrane protein
MKTISYAPAYPRGQHTDSRSMALYFGISLIIHVIFIGSVMFMPESAPRPRLGQGAINVSLVSMPGPPPAAPAPAAQTSAAPEIKPAPEPVVIPRKEAEKTPPAPVIETPPPKPLPAAPAPKKIVSLAPKANKPKAKKSLKKQTIDRQKMIDQAVARVEKKVEKSSSDSVRQAIERLKKKVAQGETAGPQTDAAATGPTAAAGAGVSGGSGGSGGRRALEVVDLYKIEVAFQVERHWAFSQQMAGDDRALQASLVFKVLPSGEITDIRFTQKSGNSYLDDSAYKAIVKASPVSAHPDGINVPYVTVGLRFTPEGLRK